MDTSQSHQSLTSRNNSFALAFILMTVTRKFHPMRMSFQFMVAIVGLLGVGHAPRGEEASVMSGRLAVATGAIAALLILGGCASTTPKPPSSYQEIALPTGASLRQSVAFGRAAMVWRDPQVDFGSYTGIIIDPVDIYRGADANFDGADEQALHRLVEFTRGEFARVAGPYLAASPGPGVARLKLMLAGLENNVPVLSAATWGLPLSLPMNLLKAAGDQPGTFTGSATLAATLFDSQTNAVLGVAMQRNYPSAMNIVATVSSRAAQQAAITEAAEGMRLWLDKVHKRTK